MSGTTNETGYDFAGTIDLSKTHDDAPNGQPTSIGVGGGVALPMASLTPGVLYEARAFKCWDGSLRDQSEFEIAVRRPFYAF
jgi:hypothetical protein